MTKGHTFSGWGSLRHMDSTSFWCRSSAAYSCKFFSSVHCRNEKQNVHKKYLPKVSVIVQSASIQNGPSTALDPPVALSNDQDKDYVCYGFHLALQLVNCLTTDYWIFVGQDKPFYDLMSSYDELFLRQVELTTGTAHDSYQDRYIYI